MSESYSSEQLETLSKAMQEVGDTLTKLNIELTKAFNKLSVTVAELNKEKN